jgi:hypothetical protein
VCLPAELRNEIYAYIFSDHTYGSSDAIRIKRHRSSDKCSLIPKFPRVAWLGLIRTSRQINGQASLLPYLLNKIRVSYPPLFQQLLHNLRRLRQPLKSLRFKVDAMVVSKNRVVGDVFTVEHLACFSPSINHIEVTVIGFRPWEKWHCTIEAARDPDYRTRHRYIGDVLMAESNGRIQVRISWDLEAEI